MNAKPPRLTVHENVYCEHPEGEIQHEFNTFDLQLNSLEEAYSRKRFATVEAAPIDLGGISKISHLLIKNSADTQKQTIPSEQELAELAKRVIRVRYHDSPRGFILHPQETMRVHPTDPQELVIESLYGNVPYRVFVVPE